MKNKINPCNKSPAWIMGAAKALAENCDFGIRDDIYKIINALDGTVTPVEREDIAPSNAAIEVPSSDKKFEIKVSKFNFPLQKRYAIAHELGHYVLHSRFGEEEICASSSHINSIMDQSEYEAHIFASSLLMPLDAMSEFKEKSVEDIAAHFQVPTYVAKAWANFLKEFEIN